MLGVFRFVKASHVYNSAICKNTPRGVAVARFIEGPVLSLSAFISRLVMDKFFEEVRR